MKLGLPLRPLTLDGVPISKRAIRWSDDAELAVATDNAVYVFTPQFPLADFPEERENPTERDKNENQQKENDDGPADDATENRYQFATGWKKSFVSDPLDPRINAHLYQNAGKPFPYEQLMHATGIPQGNGASQDDPMELDADPTQGTIESDAELYGDNDQDMEPSDVQPRSALNSATGAGAGNMTASAGTMHTDMAIEWSPAGLGRNGRCVLGVLTTNGVLTIYGEGPKRTQDRPLKARGYDTSGWETLWAVGERMIVPPQNTFGECVTSFAWAGYIGRGKALLAYRNDQMETVLLVVRAEFKTAPGANAEIAVWRVEEVARMLLEGPHPREDIADPDYAPFQSSSSLSFSPWLNIESSKTALLTYISKHYIGFRTVKVPQGSRWPVDVLPRVEVERQDSSSFCTFITSDAFIEWEQAVWSRELNAKVCRGVIVTPFRALCFRAHLNNPTPEVVPYHSVADCRNGHHSRGKSRTNPITGMIVHHPDPIHANPKATYTAVRLSATATNNDWHITTAENLTSDPNNPDWLTEITQHLEVAIPSNLPAQYDSDTEYDPNDPDTAPLREALVALPISTPEVNINRLRVCGLAASPGGGVTAVVVTTHSAQKPERGDLTRAKFRVLFRSSEAPKERKLRTRQSGTPNALKSIMVRSTEARMFDWMYGGGPGVPGWTANMWNPGDTDSFIPRFMGDKPRFPRNPTRMMDCNPGEYEEFQERVAIRVPFNNLARNMTCSVCGGRLNFNVFPFPGVQVRCENLHWFDICVISRQAILEPGKSRACGVCGLRSLRQEQLVAMIEGEEKKKKLEEMLLGNVCARCGGKFVD